MYQHMYHSSNYRKFPIIIAISHDYIRLFNMEPNLQHLQSEYHTQGIPDISTDLMNTFPGNSAHHNIRESEEMKHIMLTRLDMLSSDARPTVNS